MTSSASNPSTPEVPDPQRVEHLAQQRQLAGELGGRGGAAGLVLGVLGGPERLARHVEGDPDVGRRLVAQHVDQHRGEAVDGIRVLAGARREVLDREGEEGPIGQRVSVEEEELHAWQPSHHDRHHRRPRPRDRPPTSPDLMAGVAALRAMNPDSLMDRMGIEVLEASAERLVATMPVEGNTQPYGLLHGGASVVLAETLGSIGAALHAGPARPSSASTSTRPTTGPRARAWSPAPPRRSVSVARWPATRSSSPTRTAGASARAGSPA